MKDIYDFHGMAIPPGEITTATQWIRYCVGTTAGLDLEVSRKFLPVPGMKTASSSYADTFAH
jgi:hypothetical protein